MGNDPMALFAALMDGRSPCGPGLRPCTASCPVCHGLVGFAEGWKLAAQVLATSEVQQALILGALGVGSAVLSDVFERGEVRISGMRLTPPEVEVVERPDTPGQGFTVDPDWPPEAEQPLPLRFRKPFRVD